MLESLGLEPFQNQSRFSSDIISVSDLKGKILFVNKAYENCVGLNSDLLLGRNIFEVETGGDSAFKKVIPEIIKLGSWVGAVSLTHQNSKKRLSLIQTSVVLTDVESGEQKWIANIAKEISGNFQKRKDNEDQVNREFIKTVIHEINNPLAIIHGLAGQIKDMIELERVNLSIIKSSAEKIQRNAERVSGIVCGLSKLGDHKLEDAGLVNLNEIIKDSVELSSYNYNLSKISVKFINFNHIQMVRGQDIQLTQVFLNLINNAYEAIQNDNSPWIKLEIRPLDNKIEVHVSDSGILKCSDPEKIFESFITTKSKWGGMGLGLSISKAIIENHGGQLWLNTESETTSFIVSLPT